MSNAVVIPVDARVAGVDLDLDDPRGLLRQTVGDDSYLERVSTQALFDFGRTLGFGSPERCVTMLVDESGVLKSLPINPLASVFYPGGVIYGNAWLVGAELDPLEGWNWVSLPDTVDWAKAVTDKIVDIVLGG